MIRRIGRSIYETCSVCGKQVQLNKWLFGSLHLCLTDEERKGRFLHQLLPRSQAERNKRRGRG